MILHELLGHLYLSVTPPAQGGERKQCHYDGCHVILMLEPGSQSLYGDASQEPGVNSDGLYRAKAVYLYNRTLLSAQGESEKAMAAHSSTLAWKIPWTEEPGGLQSMGL